MGRPTKINEQIRYRILELSDDGETPTHISKIFKISKMTVSRVKRERTLRRQINNTLWIAPMKKP